MLPLQNSSGFAHEEVSPGVKMAKFLQIVEGWRYAA